MLYKVLEYKIYSFDIGDRLTHIQLTNNRLKVFMQLTTN